MHRDWVMAIEALNAGISRFWVQLISALLTNGYLKGFITGKIYTGVTKHVCVPTLNCYSCPGALFSCPVGAVQVILAGGGGLDPSASHTIKERIFGILSGTPLFVVGFLTIVGGIFGRASCGWICPFGWLQDMLYSIPSRKIAAPKAMRSLKYVFLLVTVVLLPLLWVDKTGLSAPTFCEFICPAGTLEGGILLPLLNPDLRGMLGKLFAWKFFLLVAFLVLMVYFTRPFCSWICPLGAFLGPFNKVSVYQLGFAKDKCVHCGMCDRVCPTNLKVVDELDCNDCVRCLECAKVCSRGLIKFEAFGKAENTELSENSSQTNS